MTRGAEYEPYGTFERVGGGNRICAGREVNVREGAR